MLKSTLRTLLAILFSSVSGLIPVICQGAPFAYITNLTDGTVSVIDTATEAVVDTVTVGKAPWGVAVNPAGTRAYVANYGETTVSVIDTTTNTVASTVTVGNNPKGVAVHPSGAYVYVTNSGSNTVSVIDTATDTVVGLPIDAGNNPVQAAVHPSGNPVYVLNSGYNTVTVIDTATKAIATIPVSGGGGRFYDLTVHPSGTRVYVGDFDYSRIAVIDTASNTVVAWIPTNYPLGMAFNPSGTRFYVTNEWRTNTVSVFDVPTNALVATIPVGSSPFGLSIDPSGTHVYVANDDSYNVSVIDTATNSVVKTIPVGAAPIAFGQFIVPSSGGPYAPIVTTDSMTGVTATTASGGGSVFWDGGAPVTARGVCWSASANPTTGDACTHDGTGGGLFTSSIEGLTPDTPYHARAYAVNSAGTAYGVDVSFTTSEAPPATLTVIPSGAGTGTVTSDPPGIDCGADCVKTFDSGTEVTLTATAFPGSVFASWNGCDEPDGNACTFVLNGNISVTAVFNLVRYSLTVTKTGTGTGTVTSLDGGIDCGSACSHSYVEGTPVTLTASPSGGSIFAGWGGACAGKGPCNPVMDGAKDVSARFAKREAMPFADDFSTDKGWTGYVAGGWERGPAHAGGGANGFPDPGADYTGSADQSLLGYAIGADYPDGLGEEAIVSPPIDCSGQSRVYLKFRRWLNVESHAFDHARIDLSVDGDTWAPVWENPGYDFTDDRWTQAVFDLSDVAAGEPTVFVRFVMGPTNGTRRFSGWNIDDLEVTPESLYPVEGTIGTRITVPGQGFGVKKGKVAVGGVALKVVSWTDTQIVGTISKIPLPGVYDLIIQPKAAPPIGFDASFSVKAPEIESITPSLGKAPDEVVVKGKYFGSKKGKIFLGYEQGGVALSKSCKVTSWTMDPVSGESEATFTVPPKLPPGPCDVTITNVAGSYKEEGGFTLE
jgi:YVTN family beta-propeller protein